jgi:O-antigen/teichoic acid export membrane protein
MSLRLKTARGFAFESGKVAAILLLSTVKIVVLARLLRPDAFGLLGLALALLGGLEVLTQIGSDKYLIQQERIEPGLIGCAWLFGVFRAILICIATLLLGPLYARFMHEPAAFGILSIVAFVSLVRGFRSPGVILAQREVDYLKVTAYETAAAFIDAIVVISLAYMWRDARALAWGMLGAALADVILSYALFGFGFKFRVDWLSFRTLLGVSRHFFIIGVCSYIMINGDNLIAGALLGTTMLGYYVIAYKLVDLPLRLTFQVTNRVGFSALSRLQGHTERMGRAFLALLDLQLTFLLPLITFIVLVPGTVVRSLYGPHWDQSIAVVRALGFIMIGRGLSNIVVPFLMAKGDYAFISRIKLLETIVFFCGAYAGCRLAGLIGLALGGGIGYLVAAAIRLWYIVKLGKIDSVLLLQAISPVVVTLMLPTVLTIAFEQVLRGGGVARLILSGLVFFVSYAALTLFARRDFVRQVKETISAFRRPLPVVGPVVDYR